MARATDLTISNIDRTTVKVPFREEVSTHLCRWLPHIRYFDIFEVTLESGHVGHGETMRFGSWEQSTLADVDRALGEPAIDLFWDGSLGAGLQMALFDAVGRAVGAPAHRLLGDRVRDQVPLSWWSMDLPPEGWVAEGKVAHRKGYDTIKLKGRPWFDIREGVERLSKVLPEWFSIDIDFNETLLDAEHAIPLLENLDTIPQLNCVESPIPEDRHDGYLAIREAIETDVAMHYGEASMDPSPPPTTALCDGVCDVFVGGGGPNDFLEQDNVLGAWGLPFWMQLRGTGISAAYTIQIGTVLEQATWPAITRHQVYADDLLVNPIEVVDGAATYSDNPGLGYEVDTDAIARFEVDPPESRPTERTLIEVSREGGDTMYFVDTSQMQELALKGEFPFYERDIRARVVPEGEYDDWEERYQAADSRM
jgi:galactonate dehydratase